ncbi:MAG: triose-phosphate transporter family protein [Muribaculaceae bacterium]|nr:triose-phosphate transporter family protein [Muribaculaceae bacterium]
MGASRRDCGEHAKVTILASTIILGEPFTLVMAVGTAMIIGGVILSTKN